MTTAAEGKKEEYSAECATMGLSERDAWFCVEEAVLKDRGINDEEMVNASIYSFLIRRGLYRTARAFEEETEEYGMPMVWPQTSTTSTTTGHSTRKEASEGSATHSDEETEEPYEVSYSLRRRAPNSQRNWDACSASDSDSEYEWVRTTALAADVLRRKKAQRRCLDGEYAHVADMLPDDSLLAIRLLCLEALRLPSRGRGMLLATQSIAPRVVRCRDTQTAHRLYRECLSALMTGPEGGIPLAPDSVTTMARAVNEEMQPASGPSGLNVLLSWLDWQMAQERTPIGPRPQKRRHRGKRKSGG